MRVRYSDQGLFASSNFEMPGKSGFSQGYFLANERNNLADEQEIGLLAAQGDNLFRSTPTVVDLIPLPVYPSTTVWRTAEI
jgi:hypothetical protein